MDRHELFTAMAHFHHAHAAALPIEHFAGGLTQHFFWHGRGARGEIKDAHRVILEASATDRQFRAEKDNGCLRMCANSHYRIDTAKPPNPMQ
ncbi:hypothetical protein [Paraburkholderia sp. BCC1886]|uniref:hypothetical protein n=1 Tax=Paraburkholderia sp. BCC1886 TaxID=2562670 RepID=UPI0021B4A7EC|nr:hypothetical protein [Paraburkholderia sp. BCC1886]